MRSRRGMSPTIEPSFSVFVRYVTTNRKCVTTMPSKNFGMRLEPDERRQIERLANACGKTMKDAILDAVRRHLDELRTKFDAEPGSVLSGLEDVVGSAVGPDDLSSNEDYLEDYGR